MKRNGKYYRKNEAEVMQSYGLKPTKNSGSGWLEKEDGESEHVLAQLKSTDAESVKINLLDVQKLFYHAAVSHKVGLFIIQFLQTNDELILMRREDAENVLKLIVKEHGLNYALIHNVPNIAFPCDCEAVKKVPTKTIKTGGTKSRESFYKQREVEYSKRRKK